MTPREFLGKELCRARVTAGFSSQQALADRLGFERTTIAKAETGDRVPSDPVLTAWAQACTIDIEHYQRLAHLARTSDGPAPAWFDFGGALNLASGDGGPDVLHMDGTPEGTTTEASPLVRKATVGFERVRRGALPCDQSRDLILEVADERWKQ